MSQGVYVLGGKCPGDKCPGGKCLGGIILCPWGKCPGGTCPGGLCPRTFPHTLSIIQVGVAHMQKIVYPILHTFASLPKPNDESAQTVNR